MTVPAPPSAAEGAPAPQAPACLDAASASALVSRLAGLPDLRLPARLTRDAAAPAPDVAAHLADLLAREPGVFLERYWALLAPQELAAFEPLRAGSYEVAFYLGQAEAAAMQAAASGSGRAASSEGRQGAANATARNRRLAFMHRLDGAGEYFSEAAMRAREPLIWHHHIGQHEGQPAAPPGPRPEEGIVGFATSLLAAHDEAELRARLAQELSDEQCQASEHESDSEGEEAEPPPPQQQQQVQAGQPGATAAPAGAAAAGSDGDSEMPPAAATGGGDAAAEAETRSASGGGEPEQQHQQQQRQRGAPGVDMSEAAMQQRRNEFRDEMHSRFLAGLDGAHQVYAAIDADAGLDEDWAAQQQQDAEDAWFDAE